MTDNERVELSELVSALVDGRASGAENARLQELLAASDEARRFYVRMMTMSASLHGYAAEMQSDAPEPGKVITFPVWRRAAMALAAAAAVVLGIFAARLLPWGNSQQNSDEQPDMVAHVSGSMDCKWARSGPAAGDEIARGQRLDLLSGFAELTFDSGAQITLVGPATLDVRSAWEAELHCGTLRANVPQEAIGFRVLNASVEVVDLGTEFSMTAEEGGEAEVFVLKGAVEVQPRGGAAEGSPPARSVLSEKQARRFAKSGASDVRDREKKFLRYATKLRIERSARPIAHVRWSFDEGAGLTAAAVSSLPGAHEFSLGGDATEESRWTKGRWGSALRFSGQAAVSARLPEPLSRAVRSVACWVKADGDTRVGASSQPFLAMPMGQPLKSWGELSWNTLPGDGVIGALRAQTRQSAFVGGTPLCDGKWHHVAAIFSPAGKKQGKVNAKLYVDGRLETGATNALRQNRHGMPAAQGGLLWLGGTQGGAGGSPAFAVDELVVADRALSPQEIRHLRATNRLATADTLAAN